mmetsp:Transcript_21545/g.61694  ORF Transcript_21545/g.61694 Transcript_21545/m.61694 type:complete len:305 (-) Transcript_21545:563-1477(-)
MPRVSALHQRPNELGARGAGIHADVGVLLMGDELREPRDQDLQLHPEDLQRWEVHEFHDFEEVLGTCGVPHNILDRIDLGLRVADGNHMGKPMARVLPAAHLPDALFHGVALRDHVKVQAILEVRLHLVALPHEVPGIVNGDVQVLEELINVKTRKVPSGGVRDPILGGQSHDGNSGQAARRGQDVAHHLGVRREGVPDVVHVVQERAVLPPLDGLQGFVDEACGQQCVVPIENHDGQIDLVVHRGIGLKRSFGALDAEWRQGRRASLELSVIPCPPRLQALLVLREHPPGHAAHPLQDLLALE